MGSIRAHHLHNQRFLFPSNLLERSVHSLFDLFWNLGEMSLIGSFISGEDAVHWWQGFFFVAVSFVFLLLFLYAALISKLLPPSDNAFLSAIQNDWYYCLLVPLTLPILYVAVYIHWLSMKLFKHA